MNIARKNITVNRDDIIYGDRRDPLNCPVARACRRQFPRHHTWAYARYIRVGKWVAKLPSEASAFIVKYDNQWPFMRFFMRPFTFSVEFRDAIEPVGVDECGKTVYE